MNISDKIANEMMILTA